MDSMVNILLGATVLCILGATSRVNAGGQLYKPSVETCCNGKRVPGDYSKSCCGDASYNYATHMCCYGADDNETLHPNTFGYNTGCCNHTIYNSLTHFCCYDTYTVKELPSEIGADEAVNYYSCGGKLCDMRNQTCCYTGNGSIVQENTSPCADYCNGEEYDSGVNVCCNEELFKHDGNSECCGDGIYDPCEQICCGEVAFDLIPGDLTACCGSKPYDKKTQLCCSEEIKPRVDLFSKCCGSGTYKYGTETCCGDEAIPSTSFRTGCCGGKAYEMDAQICCNRVVSDRKSMKTQCCGTSAFEPNQKTCCGGSVLDLTPGNQDWGCCMDYTNSYSDNEDGDYEENYIYRLKGELKENDEECDF